MKDCGDHYEYICVYVDDIAIMSRDCTTVIDALKAVGGFKLSGYGPIKYHIGGDFERDVDGVLCYGCKMYINRMTANYERMFGVKP